MNPIRQEASCSSLFGTTIRDVPAGGGGMWHGRLGHDPYHGPEALVTSAAVDAYGIGAVTPDPRADSNPFR